LSNEEFQRYLQSVSFRSLKAEVVDRRSTTMQRFDPPSMRVILPQQERAEKVEDVGSRRRNPLWLLFQTLWGRLGRKSR